MAMICLDLWCSQCKSDNVVSSYSEKESDIICECTNCQHKGTINDFYYLLDDYEE